MQVIICFSFAHVKIVFCLDNVRLGRQYGKQMGVAYLIVVTVCTR